MKKFCFQPNTALLITDRLTRKRLSGIDIEEGFLFIAEKSFYLTDARYFLPAKVKIKKAGLTPILYQGVEDLVSLITENAIKELFIDFEKSTVSEFNTYKTFGVEIFDGSEYVKSVYSIKTESELKDIQKACKITQKAFYKTLKGVREGITEKQLQNILIDNLFSFGAHDLSFNPIIAFGKNTAVPHHETGKTKLKAGMPILMDFGCKINGYCSDYTRTVAFKGASEQFVNVYNAVLNANQLAIDKIHSGITGADADKIAREYLASVGYKEEFTHSLGHGIGLRIHEAPRLSKKYLGTLEDNMVFSIEPGVYIDNKFGVRIEDTVVLENGKVKRLFDDKKELIIL